MTDTGINNQIINSFFTGNPDDTRGTKFFNLAMNHGATDIASPINSTGSQNTQYLNIILAKFYKNNTGMRDEDVHPEFITFIKDVALWHRKLNNKDLVGDTSADLLREKIGFRIVTVDGTGTFEAV